MLSALSTVLHRSNVVILPVSVDGEVFTNDSGIDNLSPLVEPLASTSATDIHATNTGYISLYASQLNVTSS